MSDARHRNLIVIGASAGGIDAILTLVSRLPANLPAAICIVVHQGETAPSEFPQLISSRGPLPARHAIHGEPIEEGHIYVAPPDTHLGVRPGYLRVVRGPKENGHRPSVDVLFRTASAAYGSHVIGVVLSGRLDCGTAGLLSIKARGGMAIVQDPVDARFPEMPESAIRHASVDHIVSIDEMAPLLVREVGERVRPEVRRVSRSIQELEGEELGGPVGVVCPLCQGHMTMTNIGDFQSFRCHVGHSFSLDSLAIEQAEEVERALWAAARALEEGANVADRVALKSPPDLARRLEEKAMAHRYHLGLLRDILLDPGRISPLDAHRATLAEQAKEPSTDKKDS